MGRQGEQTGSTCGCPSVIHPLLEQSITFNAFVATASGENPKKNKSERGEDDKKRRMRRRKRERETAIMKGGELRESDRVKSEKRARGNECEDDCGGIRGGRECDTTSRLVSGSCLDWPKNSFQFLQPHTSHPYA